MYYSAKNRASAYLLVVSVVAILALIGSVFLLSSIDDRRESDARLEAAPTRAVADQIVELIQKNLVDDLYIDNAVGLYSADSHWHAYVDYPSPDYTDGYDAFLASTERSLADGAFVKAGCWPKVSNIAGMNFSDDVRRLFTNVNPAWEYIPTRTNRDYYFGSSPAVSNYGLINIAAGPFSDGNAATPDAIPLIDTDGDDVRDALLMPSNSYSGSGKQYYYAARVVDLSAFVNVNTAMNNRGSDGFSDGWMTVGMVDPAKLPAEWPELNSSDGLQVVPNGGGAEAWAWRDDDGDSNNDSTDGNGSRDNGEPYAPGYGWQARIDGSGPVSFDMTTIDEGLPRSLPPAGQSFPNTPGRGVDGTTSERNYPQYYNAYVTRPLNFTDDPDGDSVESYFVPFDVSDEIACRWLDTTRWTGAPNYMQDYMNDPDNYATAYGDKLKSSRLARLTEDGVWQNGGIPATEKWLHWAYYSRYLTTMSSSRELARYRPMRADSGSGVGISSSFFADSDTDGTNLDDEIEEWPSLALKVDVNLPVTTDAEKIAAFNQYRIAFAWALGLDENMSPSDREAIYYQACELAIKLVDYRDADDEISCVDVNKVGLTTSATPVAGEGCLGKTGLPYYVYGVERYPVISHVWSKAECWQRPGWGSANWDYWVLVAFYNPFDYDIDFSDWEFEYDGNYTFPATTTIPSGEYVLFVRDETDMNLDIGYSVANNNVFEDSTDLYWSGEYTLHAPAVDLLTGLVQKVPFTRYDCVNNNVGPIATVSDVNQYAFDNPAPALGVDPLFTSCMRSDLSGFTTYPAYQSYQDDSGATTKNFSATGSAGSDSFPNNADWASGGWFASKPQLPVFIRNADLVNLAELDRLFNLSDSTSGPDAKLEKQIESVIGGVSSPTEWNDIFLNSMLYSPVPSGTDEDQVTLMPEYCRLSNYFTVNSRLTDYEMDGTTELDNDGDGTANRVVGPGSDNINDLIFDRTALTANDMRELAMPGRININTAPVATLSTLPLLISGDAESDRLQIAADIVAYRDRTNYIDNTGTSGADFTGGRFSSDLRENPGFASAGELAALLREGIDAGAYSLRNGYGPAYGMDASGYDDGYDTTSNAPDDDITKYDMRWAYLSNLVTVNSDVFCAYIWVQEGPELNADGRRYMVILDRTNCVSTSDMPEIRAFVEIPTY